MGLQKASVDDLHMLCKHDLMCTTSVCATVCLRVTVRNKADEKCCRRVQDNTGERPQHDHSKNKGNPAEDTRLRSTRKKDVGSVKTTVQ